MLKAVGYIRVSRVGAREHLISPDEQRKAIEADGKAKGFEVVKWFEELDVSGADRTRPMWNEAIEMVASGEVEAFAVWNLSRFSRSVVDGAEAMKRIEDAGGKFFSASGDSGDSSPAGQFQRTIWFAMGEFERETKKQSFERAQIQAIERGLFIAPRVPTGYTRNSETRKLEVNEMAPVVTKLFEMRAEGKSWLDLLKYFTANSGNPDASRQTIMNMMKNPTYLGWVRHGQKVNKTAHDPLVSERVFEIVASKQVPRKQTGRAAAESLLSGLVRCDGCDYTLTVTTNGRKTLNYRCGHPNCTKRASANQAVTDAYVVGMLMTYWGTYQFDHVERTSGNASEIEADIVEARKLVADAQYDLDKFEQNKRTYLTSMEPDEFASMLQGLKSDLAEHQLALDMALGAQTEPAVRERVADLWEDWSHEDRKEWLNRVLDVVIIKQAGGKRVPVSTRMAVGMKDGIWLHGKAGWSSEPFAEPRSPLHIVARRKARKALSDLR